MARSPFALGRADAHLRAASATLDAEIDLSCLP
jgi:hypothetical protein